MNPAMPKSTALQAAGHFLLDLLYPPRCGGCDTGGVWLCDSCRAAIAAPEHGGWKCAACRKPMERRDERLVCPSDCAPAALLAFLAAGQHTGPLREAVHNLKYNGWKALAPDLAALIAAAVREAAADAPWAAGVQPSLLAVPLHRRRRRYRGFNQAELLAGELSRSLGWPQLGGLERRVNTPQQVGQSQADRIRNMEDAFVWRGTAPLFGPIVLVDDVFTTGATLRACAAALAAAGSGPVYALALAAASDS